MSFNKETKTYNYSYLVFPYLPTPPLGQDMTQGQFFKRT